MVSLPETHIQIWETILSHIQQERHTMFEEEYKVMR